MPFAVRTAPRWGTSSRRRLDEAPACKSCENDWVMLSVSSVLFDLDGTLVDPAGAITSGIRYALTAHGLPDPGEERVAALVGPPLQIGLRTLDGVSAENINQVIATYRQRYAASGMAQSRIYPGISQLLGELRAAGVYLAVTTAKPERIARQLLEVQGLDTAFDAVHGNAGEAGALGASKAHIVAAALEHAGLTPDSSVVVGDRYYDLDAARENRVQSIGVRWGFAQGNELDVANFVVSDTAELTDLLLGRQPTHAATQEGTKQ